MLPRVLEEGQRIMKLGVDLHVYIMSNDSNACRPNHPAKNSACASVESTQCRADSSLQFWHSLIHVHLSLQVSCACSTTKPKQTCSPQFRGESYMFLKSFSEVSCSAR